MIVAFEAQSDRPDFARWLAAAALSHELVLRPIGKTVYFMPPYIVTDDEFALIVERTLAILDAC
jgi:adenosylmethionine-8-amino-7-oxononanoate aminotransferase